MAGYHVPRLENGGKNFNDRKSRGNKVISITLFELIKCNGRDNTKNDRLRTNKYLFEILTWLIFQHDSNSNLYLVSLDLNW